MAIKKIEYTSQNCHPERIAIEGVIQEALASSNVLNYYIENKQSFSSTLKAKSEALDKPQNFLNLIVPYGNLTSKINNGEVREATFASIVAIKRGNPNE